ncbi:MAG: hypothetical protein JST00_31740 [Deltaproteobacteria bacterium]|nr:hypothetical protein [Deltaproteobacteria bacterium]
MLRRILVSLVSVVALGCNDDTTTSPIVGSAPPAPTSTTPPADSSATDAGGLPVTPPAPGPAALDLKLPYGYMFVLGKKTFETAGFIWRDAAMPDGTIVQIDRSLVYVELNAGVQGGPAGGTPVRFRGMSQGQPSQSFICAARRSGSSGRSYVVLDKVGTDPATGGPWATAAACDWFLVKAAPPLVDRYHIITRFEGRDVYITGGESDTVSGYRVVVGDAPGSSKPAWQLVGMDKEGQKLTP